MALTAIDPLVRLATLTAPAQTQPIDEAPGGGGLDWMAWTSATFIFVAVVLGCLLALTVLAVLWPSTERRGFLPMPTARGDRIYVGLLGTGLIFIGLLAFTSLPLGVGVGLSALWMVVVVLWG